MAMKTREKFRKLVAIAFIYAMARIYVAQSISLVNLAALLMTQVRLLSGFRIFFFFFCMDSLNSGVKEH